MRLQIVRALADGAEHTCKSFGLPVTKSTCTHHFKVLREAGVIQQRAQGTTRLNRLRREDLETRFPGLLGCVLKAARHAELLEDADGDTVATRPRVIAVPDAADAPESPVVA
jgi:DNA-binding transcriptional ArsR family regulator